MLFTACEKEIQLDVDDHDPELTVLCIFSPDEPFSIQLAKSQSISNKNPDYSISKDADVQLCDGTKLLEKLPRAANSSDSESKYRSESTFPQSQKTYTLKVEVDGLGMVKASSTVPSPVEISHTAVGAINLLNSGSGNIQDYQVKLSVQFDDPVAESNYYQVTFKQELRPTINSANSSIIVEDVLYYNTIDESLGNNFNVMDGGVLFNDFTFDGTSNDLVFEPIFSYDRSTSIPENIIIELRTVSEEYYKYFASVYRQRGQNGTVPFTDPTIIYSNIENGNGVFAGYSKRQVKSPIEF